MLYYSDCSVYSDEEDCIGAIWVSGDVAFVELQRRNRGVFTYEIDVYTPVISAKVKKSDIQEIRQLKLVVEKYSITP